MTTTDDAQPGRLPGKFKEFVRRFPELGEAHQAIGKASESAGPLDRKAIRRRKS